MSYNPNNKSMVILAWSFAVIMTMTGVAKAQDAVPSLLEEENAGDAVQQIEQDNTAVAESTEQPVDTSFLDEQPADSNEAVPQPETKLDSDLETLPEVGLFDEDSSADEEVDTVTMQQSPFENFGNAILSKVDNDLFNQMSQIEKQTTLLNLELKREDVRNKVEALKAARVLARQEAEARRIAEEQKIKDMEAARKAELLEAEEKLRNKEIELEKVRQEKVLNDYMNEVLVMNQKWIEQSGMQQNRINELEDERKELIAFFEDKLEKVKSAVDAVNGRSSDAVKKYYATLNSLNAQVMQLRKDVVDSETRIQMMREQSSSNPFAQSKLDPNSASVDLAQEYAIMDITGQGEDIVAKIVSRDGTTFTVHRGSVLRGGETVLKITEKYIAFDKKGIKAYLYPGGTIMEYEPVNIFNEAEKTPETSSKQSIRSEGAMQRPTGIINKGDVAPAFGKPMNSTVETKPEVKNKQHRTKSLSFSEGMFAH